MILFFYISRDPPRSTRFPSTTLFRSAAVDEYLHNLYRIDPDFVYSVSRDFVRSCQTPMLVMPDNTPSHSYEAAMEVGALAPNADVTVYP